MTAQECRAQMIGQTWQGTVTDETTGSSASYSWVCDNVSQTGLDDRVIIVLNNWQGAYREFCFSEEKLKGYDAVTLVKFVDERLRQGLAQEVGVGAFSELVGEAI